MNHMSRNGRRRSFLFFLHTHTMSFQRPLRPLWNQIPRFLTGHTFASTENVSLRLTLTNSMRPNRNPPSAAHPRIAPLRQHARCFSYTTVIRQNRTQGDDKSTAVEKAAANALSRAGKSLESSGRDLELAGKVLGSDGSTLVSVPLPPPPPPPEPPQSSIGFSATQFSTGSNIIDVFITTVIGLSMGECGGLRFTACTLLPYVCQPLFSVYHRLECEEDLPFSEDCSVAAY